MSKQGIMLQLEQESFFLKAWDTGTAEWCKSIRQPTVFIVKIAAAFCYLNVARTVSQLGEMQ